MVSIKSVTIAALAGMLSLATASPTIGSLSTPPRAAAGSTIKTTLGTSIYVQNWEDFAIIWGITSPKVGGQAADGTIYIGQQIGYTPLYGTKTERLNSFAVNVTIPADIPTGDWLLVAAVPYLVGLSGLTDIHSFNSTIHITA
ncbi:hypothetical protein F5Y17DRAFT_454391 [Xylariaceae sp. FL0594]|nr:hypothetical protein F5Y17DRAFT_454391 [Xylariaceae sp. FL0594]